MWALGVATLCLRADMDFDESRETRPRYENRWRLTDLWRRVVPRAPDVREGLRE